MCWNGREVYRMENTITFEDIQKANETIRTTDIKGKDYAEVNQRIKAFRMVHPNGDIDPQLVSNENGVCIFRADVYDGNGKHLGSGTAYEKENSTFINKTSYIENCETSAVGRALGMCGFGIDTSVASAEEVQNAMNNQITVSTEEEARAIKLTFGKHQGKTLGELYDADEDSYLMWLFDKGQDLNIKKAVSILTGVVEHSPEETKEIVNDLPITEPQKQQLKDKYADNTDELKLKVCSLGKMKLSELTYAEADKLLGE